MPPTPPEQWVAAAVVFVGLVLLMLWNRQGAKVAAPPVPRVGAYLVQHGQALGKIVREEGGRIALDSGATVQMADVRLVAGEWTLREGVRPEGP